MNEILTRLVDVKYLTLIDVSCGHHNQKLNEKSSYLTTFSCPFGRYQYIRLPFEAEPEGNMFQEKMDELFNDISNVFGIADDILIARLDADGRDHDKRFEQALHRCR